MRSLFSIIIILLLFPGSLRAQDIYEATGVSTEFFSSAPIEDIAAHADGGMSLWNTRNGEITFRINIRSFDFEKGKMQEHFNENFMESHKYPHATFKAKVQQQPDLSKEGEYLVTLDGILEIHGVAQERKIDARVTVREDSVILQSEFNVAVADHDIKIPKLLFRNIAEVVSLEVHANYKKLEL